MQERVETRAEEQATQAPAGSPATPLSPLSLSSPAQVLWLQRAAGNRAVAALARTAAPPQPMSQSEPTQEEIAEATSVVQTGISTMMHSGCTDWCFTPLPLSEPGTRTRWGILAHAFMSLDYEHVMGVTRGGEVAMRRDGPLLFFSRHAGPGDTVLLVELLMTTYDRLPSVVFNESLTLDPSIDLLEQRLPVPHSTPPTLRIVAAHPRGVVQARRGWCPAPLPRGRQPHGRNATARRSPSCGRKGHRREAAAGEQLRHVLLPHPAGVLAAMQRNPACDVIFGSHTGLGLVAYSSGITLRSGGR